MKVLIVGATGLIGGELQKSFADKGYETLLATRRKPETPNEVRWSIDSGFDAEALARLEDVDAVVHLAGENVGERWTEDRKKRIYDSRILGTRAVVDTISRLEKKPEVLVSASGIIYGSRGDELLTEDVAAGNTFLGKLTVDWEAEALRAKDFGVRVVTPRIAPVLAKEGGALGKMLTPFNLGLGGVVGSGKQWMPWITLDDLVEVINFAITNKELSGAVNAASPNPVRNEEFTKTLGGVLNRPTVLPLPEFAVRLMFGEMGEELLLGSYRVVPKRLLDLGFRFRYPELEPALRHTLLEKSQ